MSRTFIRLAAMLPEQDVEAATDHMAVKAVSVDRGPEALCRPCVELDPGVAALLARASFACVARSAEMDQLAKGWKPS